jgi:hypothetical protein
MITVKCRKAHLNTQPLAMAWNLVPGALALHHGRYAASLHYVAARSATTTIRMSRPSCSERAALA